MALRVMPTQYPLYLTRMQNALNLVDMSFQARVRLSHIADYWSDRQADLTQDKGASTRIQSHEKHPPSARSTIANLSEVRRELIVSRRPIRR